jgi:hypothetical protein
MGKPVATATPNPDSIPWLLLKATDHQGEGVMKRVTSIQRLSTKGGRSPATGCDAQQKGQEARSHYIARSIFSIWVLNAEQAVGSTLSEHPA